MPIISVGVDHEHAPLALLEAVTVGDADWHKVLAELHSLEDLEELVLVSTCLRTEVYAVIERFHGAVDGITAVLAEHADLPVEQLTGSMSVHFDRGVPAHLFAVAAGLRSAVPGETEVLGQIRRSLERAEADEVVGPELAELFRHAISAGRRARAETGIARGTTSFAHAAVRLAADRLGGLDGRSVVVVGAGQLAEGVIDALVEHRHGAPGRVAIANRTRESAARLAARTGATEHGLDELEALVETADLAILAVEADSHVLTRSGVSARSTPLLIVDLGMPRAADPDVGDLPGVTLLDLEHLREVVDAALRDRRDELTAAEAIVDEEVERHLAQRRERGAAPVVTALRAHLDALRDGELERASALLDSLTDAQREQVEQLVRSLVAKIAHEPTVSLRASAGSDRGRRLAEAARQLFDL